MLKGLHQVVLLAPIQYLVTHSFSENYSPNCNQVVKVTEIIISTIVMNFKVPKYNHILHFFHLYNLNTLIILAYFKILNIFLSLINSYLKVLIMYTGCLNPLNLSHISLNIFAFTYTYLNYI